MGKLDVSCLRHLTKNDLRVLVAVEMGMKNHDLVPTDIIINIARLRHGGAHRFISNLHRFKLVYHEQKGYDGYRLTYAGYDMLALNAFINKGLIIGLGRKIGVGKESDVYLAQNADGKEVVLKFNRLGRTSFRNIKNKRDYLVHRKSASWLYMSRLAAMKEFAFMKALYDEGFPTPVPIECNRHVVLMSAVPGFPMSQVRAGQMQNPMVQLGRSLDILVRLAKHGLIHCDLNEFNLMVSRTGEVTVIDFPQMISTSHPNAQFYFDRDVKSLIKFFKMKMKITIPEEEVPTFANILKEQEEAEALALKEEELATKVNNLMIPENDDVNNEAISPESTGAAEEEVTMQSQTSKKKKNARNVKKRTRLDEVVKASGFISVKDDEKLLSYIEDQRVALEEALASGQELYDSDEDEDDVIEEGEEEEEEGEDKAPPLIKVGAGNTDEICGRKQSSASEAPVVTDARESDDEYEVEEKGILRDLNPQKFVKVNKFGYNQVSPNLNGKEVREEDEEGEDSDEEDGSVRAGWTKEGGDSIVSDISTSTTSTHSRGYHGSNYRPQRHRNKSSQPEGKRNSNKITYRGSKIHKPKA